jgi:hypothetical protein
VSTERTSYIPASPFTVKRTLAPLRRTGPRGALGSLLTDALEQERPVVHKLYAQHAARAGHKVPHRLGVEEQAQRGALAGLGAARQQLGAQALVRAHRDRQPLPQRLELLELVAL